MLKYEHLLNKEFDYGKVDCYSLARDFYRDNFGIDLKNYAHPTNFWDEGINLFMDNFYSEGFRVVDEHPSDWRPADAILMAIGSSIANHCAVLLPGGKILHHMPNRLSRVEDYRGLYRNTTVAVLRHKDVTIPQDEETVDLMSLLPSHIKRKLEENAREATDSF